jgi:hypothetical protein
MDAPLYRLLRCPLCLPTCLSTALRLQVGYINYAVSIDQAWPIVQSLLNTGRVTRPAVGLTLLPVDRLTDERERATSRTALLPAASVVAADGLPYVTGALVTFARPGFPADAAGIRQGDVILEINDARMRRLGDYFDAVGPVYDPTVRLRCKIFRPAPGAASGRGGSASGDGGQVMTVVVAPAPKEGEAAASGVMGRRRRHHPFGFSPASLLLGEATEVEGDQCSLQALMDDVLLHPAVDGSCRLGDLAATVVLPTQASAATPLAEQRAVAAAVELR